MQLTASMGYCGYCWKDCGNTELASAHVLACPSNSSAGSLLGSEQEFIDAQRSRRHCMVNSYLRQLPLQMRTLVADAIAPNLAACGINLRERQRRKQLLSLPQRLREHQQWVLQQHQTERVQQLRQLVRLMCEHDAAAALPVVNVQTLQEQAATIAALQQDFAQTEAQREDVAAAMPQLLAEVDAEHAAEQAAIEAAIAAAAAAQQQAARMYNNL
jgi:hypothetical protein